MTTHLKVGKVAITFSTLAVWRPSRGIESGSKHCLELQAVKCPPPPAVAQWIHAVVTQ